MEAISYSGFEVTSSSAWTININSSKPRSRPKDNEREKKNKFRKQYDEDNNVLQLRNKIYY